MKNQRRTFLKNTALIGSAMLARSSARAADSAAVMETNTSEIWTVFKARRSVRRFKADPVPDEHITQILDAARLAPTSGNQQPWLFLVIRDQTRIEALKSASIQFQLDRFDSTSNSKPSERAGFEERVRRTLDSYFSAPVYIVVLTDNKSAYPDYNHWDGPLAAGFLMLAARALGYGTVHVTDTIPDEITKSVLGIPDRYTRVCITPVGVPEEWPASPTKKPLEALIAYESIPG